VVLRLVPEALGLAASGRDVRRHLSSGPLGRALPRGTTIARFFPLRDEIHPVLGRYFTFLAPKKDAHELAAIVAESVDVEHAYVDAAPAPPPAANPRLPDQGFVRATPEGVDADHAWANVAGGDGAGVLFVDVEQGWNLKHEDLAQGTTKPIHGVNRSGYRGHGTAVVAIVCAIDNRHGGLGIAHACDVEIASAWKTAKKFSHALAVESASYEMHLRSIRAGRSGDVLLIEGQVDRKGVFLPVELLDAEYDAIRVATEDRGVVVVECAGNGGTDLDTVAVLAPSGGKFRDSGAILVGACGVSRDATTLDYSIGKRLSSSNYGDRVDCFAWGSLIDVAGSVLGDCKVSDYTTDFGRTSGAGAIVAGVAVVVQSARDAAGTARLTPEEMRDLLGDSKNGTPSADPKNDKIGSMPDLAKIL
jgi:subtilisin family serine protease